MTPETPIDQLRFAAIDFESAGAARGRTDVPVQVGCAIWSVGDGHHSPFVSYLRASEPITWSARKVHGIRDEDLEGAPSLLELWPRLRGQLGQAVVVAHGKGTEKRFLRAFPGHGFGPWLDTLLVARAAFPEWGDHSLSALCQQLGIEDRVDGLVPGRRWHDALFDAVGSLVLLAEIIDRFGLGELPVSCLLQPDTSPWHRLRRS